MPVSPIDFPSGSALFLIVRCTTCSGDYLQLYWCSSRHWYVDPGSHNSHCYYINSITKMGIRPLVLQQAAFHFHHIGLLPLLPFPNLHCVNIYIYRAIRFFYCCCVWQCVRRICRRVATVPTEFSQCFLVTDDTDMLSHCQSVWGER